MSVRMALHLQQHQTILRNLRNTADTRYSDFPVKEERTMEGVVIRSTDNHGEYIWMPYAGRQSGHSEICK